jgi:hypothetical protein
VTLVRLRGGISPDLLWAHGLLVQWRAAEWNEASIRLARALGLTDVGSQFSLRLDD